MLDMLHVVLQVFRDVCEIAIKSQLERSATQEQTPPLLQVLVLLLAFFLCVLDAKTPLSASPAGEGE
jgi:hypothetical protein